ncbi:regulatory protein RecX [Knoellia sp. CPCC 206450]|uniref:regulatory protein RecX n=1 Tax=Knoellia tibetensis TaxID=3404798 RepID=UPI003B436035
MPSPDSWSSSSPPPSWAAGTTPSPEWAADAPSTESVSPGGQKVAPGAHEGPQPVDALRAALDEHASTPADRGRARRQGGRRSAPPPPDPAVEGVEPDAHDVARQIVLRQLTNAPKSRSQLEQALARKGCDPDVAATVLDRMEEVGLVDDEAYAGMLVRSQQAGRGLARRALAQTLRQKGVSDEVAETVLDDVDPAVEEERARELVEKRLRRLHGLDATVQMRRLAGMLARKGYPSEVSMRVIREAIATADEHRRD